MEQYTLVFLGIVGLAILAADFYGVLEATEVAATLTEPRVAAACVLTAALGVGLALLIAHRLAAPAPSWQPCVTTAMAGRALASVAVVATLVLLLPLVLVAALTSSDDGALTAGATVDVIPAELVALYRAAADACDVH